VGSYVYVADYDGNLSALRRSDGQPIWSEATGHTFNSSDISSNFTGLAAAERKLIVPTESTLMVYGPN